MENHKEIVGRLLIVESPFFVGSEKRVKFWKDKWCGNEPSCVPFLLYLS